MSTLTNLKVFSDTVSRTVFEGVAQNVDAFNAASAGCIVMTNKPSRGEYSSELTYQQISGLVRVRDPNASTAVSNADLVRFATGGVKLARSIGPANLDPQLYAIIQEDPQTAGIVIGQMGAEQRFRDMLNIGIGAAIGAALNVGSTLVNDTSAVPAHTGLMNTAIKFGDANSRIKCWVMHSSVWNLLVNAGFTTGTSLFTYANVAVMQDIMGRRFVITDSSYMNSSADWYTLGLQPGGIVIEQQGTDRTAIVDATGQNITSTYQTDYEYVLKLMGYKYDEDNGGAFPDNATVVTGSNWDKAVTAVRDCAGVVYTTHAS